MATINILKPSVFSKIAAGEVVDKPASIVKELVENSIDAGANKISVEIVEGGINSIVVSDNGCGIDSSELEKAFLPHATSKIKDEYDLEEIATLGFRGEALASIAVVSEVSIITKTKDAETGTFMNLIGGEVIAKKEKGAPDGTQITISNLFYNTPVRQRFLRKPKQEESDVTEVMARLILANPDISFKYIANEKIIYNSSGNGLEDAIYAVYGANTLQNILPISTTKNDIEINGFIGKPSFTKPNRTYQTVVINGRYVQSALIGAAVARIYEDYMLKHAFPFFVLHLTIPLEKVDVNVHPNKLEVKFSDNQLIFRSVLHAVDEVLIESRKANNDITREQATLNIQTSENELQNNNYNANNGILDTENNQNTSYNNILNNIKFMPTADSNTLEENDSKITEVIINSSNTQVTNNDYKQNNYSESTTPEPVLTQFLAKGFSNIIDSHSIKIVGKIFNTFIIVEVNDKVYIIDQHAAHERLLYDKMVENLKLQNRYNQPLLIPFILNVNPQEKQFLLDNQQVLEELGFELELFSESSFRVSTVPYPLPFVNIQDFFDKILSEMNTILKLETKDLVLDHLAQCACKHAVKGGDDLDEDEIENLLFQVAQSPTQQMQCPHGRPFVIELKRSDLDKWFKRIV